MGNLQAKEISQVLPLEQAIAWHFSGNCYPPIPAIMIPVAVSALAAIADEDYDQEIDLPEGVSFKDGSSSVSASQAIRSLHLEAWID
tara:strand:+ start:150 stop:410 length:261 start_codon:yes stop_codon:yes gene_type:complete